MKTSAAILGALSFAFALAAMGQYTNKSSVLDGSGTRSAGGTYTNISAAGQPGGIAESSGGGFVNQAGFLQTFFIKPGLDTDGDGIPDEADQDNDGDGLADATEIGGGAFNPGTPTLVNNPDSDDDGTPDGEEAAAGTDPTDAGAQLRIVAISDAAGSKQVAWRARGNNERTYVARSRDELLSGNAGTQLFSNTVAGGTAPWYVVTNTTVDGSATTAEVYTVTVLH